MSKVRSKAVAKEGDLVMRGNLSWIELGVFADEFPQIAHGFTTKRGAGRRIKSKVDFSGSSVEDSKPLRQSVVDLAKELGIKPDRVVFPKQEHGGRILLVKDELPGDPSALRNERADAIITNIPELAIGVRTADCVPILLYDHRANVIAAVHAGWRGTVAGVLEKTVRLMAREFHTEPGCLAAAIGPAVGGDNFEVDEPVLTQFRERFDFWSRFARPTRNSKWLIDLKMINAYLLASAGVQERSLELSPLCTIQEKDLFYSHRREGESAGRMFNFIMLKKG